MIDLSLPLIGPAASVFATLRSLAAQHSRLAVLCDGDPGCGKSHLLDKFALTLTHWGRYQENNACRFAIEQINGQSLNIEIVREWRERACYGNLFSSWTVKRIDELDQVRPNAMAELLSYLDYLQPRVAVLASTNEYVKLRNESKGRLETRFVRINIAAPSLDEAVTYLRKQFKLPAQIAREIANGAIPEGCLPPEGLNMRACVEDAKGYLAARSAAA